MMHTKGPWEAQKIFKDNFGIIRSEAWEISTPDYDVATYIPHSAPIRSEDDARLIAAAPDLLEACEKAWWWINNNVSDEDGSVNGVYNLLSMAIAKAKGE